jgi:uncharacterized protein (DUF3820 family)
MSLHNPTQITSYVCSKPLRYSGSYKLISYTKTFNQVKEKPVSSMLEHLSYDHQSSTFMAIKRLIHSSLDLNNTIHTFENHVFNTDGVPLSFGKYKGKLLSDVYLIDPGYISWLANIIKPTSFINQCILLQCQKWSQTNRIDPVLEYRKHQYKRPQ